jgi:predicted DNA-binding transcriptional regulator AlpA
MKEKEQLPGWPRGLSRKLAASYIGVSIALFDDMVRDGRMPLPVHINRRVVWDIRLIDRAFERLAGWDWRFRLNPDGQSDAKPDAHR